MRDLRDMEEDEVTDDSDDAANLVAEVGSFTDGGGGNLSNQPSSSND